MNGLFPFLFINDYQSYINQLISSNFVWPCKIQSIRDTASVFKLPSEFATPWFFPHCKTFSAQPPMRPNVNSNDHIDYLGMPLPGMASLGSGALPKIPPFHWLNHLLRHPHRQRYTLVKNKVHPHVESSSCPKPILCFQVFQKQNEQQIQLWDKRGNGTLDIFFPICEFTKQHLQYIQTVQT